MEAQKAGRSGDRARRAVKLLLSKDFDKPSW